MDGKASLSFEVRELGARPGLSRNTRLRYIRSGICPTGTGDPKRRIQATHNELGTAWVKTVKSGFSGFDFSFSLRRTRGASSGLMSSTRV